MVLRPHGAAPHDRPQTDHPRDTRCTPQAAKVTFVTGIRRRERAPIGALRLVKPVHRNSNKSALLPPPLVELQKLAGLASNASVSNFP